MFTKYLFQLGILSLVSLARPSPNPIPAAGPDPDVPFSPIQDPEDPDFNGVVDFSKAKPGPDGSWCITKVIRCEQFLSKLIPFDIYFSIIVNLNDMFPRQSVQRNAFSHEKSPCDHFSVKL